MITRSRATTQIPCAEPPALAAQCGGGLHGGCASGTVVPVRSQEQWRSGLIDVPTDMLIWLVAGVALGVFVTMMAFALIVAADRRAFRRKRRRAGASPPEAPAPTAPATAMAAPAVDASPIAAALPAPVAEVPAAERPALSVEEMFARAFEAAVPTVPPAKPGDEPGKP